MLSRRLMSVDDRLCQQIAAAQGIGDRHEGENGCQATEHDTGSEPKGTALAVERQ
jgi:hypothetical protein